MTKPRKKSAEPAPEPITPRIGDKVPSRASRQTPGRLVLEVEYVASDGTEVT